jgi:hypothetical protein
MGVGDSNTSSGNRITSSPKNADLHWNTHIILANVYWRLIGRSVKLTAHLHMFTRLIISGFLPVLFCLYNVYSK